MMIHSLPTPFRLALELPALEGARQETRVPVVESSEVLARAVVCRWPDLVRLSNEEDGRSGGAEA
ncbi:MAG TPA: hypothetical protein VKA53_05500 [Thermoanaerobaculia bacterium]|nr:hypothetical protein [Thermoanaerobaculia bacterium]